MFFDQNKTRFDAFRSIFPAAQYTGAPKVRAMQLIAELEGEKRGVLRRRRGLLWVQHRQRGRSSEMPGAMDTCIALRTMMLKDGVAYLQAGGGIVFDSDPYDEYIETINKLERMLLAFVAPRRSTTAWSPNPTQPEGSGKSKSKEKGTVMNCVWRFNGLARRTFSTPGQV